VRFRPAGGHQLIPYLRWEWDVHQGVTVDMTDFPLPEPIFCAALAVRIGSDSIPAQHGLLDCFVCSKN